MPSKRRTLAELAREADLDNDEALVTLWLNGFEYLNAATDAIPKRDLNKARRALGVATRRDLKNPNYWQKLLGVSDEVFDHILLELGIVLSNASRTLPPGAVSRLRSYVRRQRRAVDREPLVHGPVEFRIAPAQPAIWNPPGHEREIRFLTADEVLSIHFALAEDFAKTDDPIDPCGVRSNNLLESAVFRPQTSLGNQVKYPTVESAAAALLHSLVLDHAFHNGNKRTALVATLVFLDENDMMPTCHEDELFRLVLLAAQHRVVESSPAHADTEVLAIANWLCERVRPVEFGDRPLPFRKLRRILSGFGCVFEFGSVGNRINILRPVQRRAFLGRIKEVMLKTQVYYGGEGREVERNTIRKIRDELELDDTHGIDSLAFYGETRMEVSEFITQYRKTLKRLARL